MQGTFQEARGDHCSDLDSTQKNEEQRKAAIAELLPGKDIGSHVDTDSPEVAAELEKHGIQRTETHTGIYRKQTLSTNGALGGPAAKVFFAGRCFEDRVVATTECALLAVLNYTTPTIAKKIRIIRDENTPIDEIVRTLKPKTFIEDGVWLPLRADAPPIAEDGKDLLSRLFDLCGVLTPETRDAVRFALDVGLLGERVLVGLVEPYALRGRNSLEFVRRGGEAKGLL